MQIRQSGLCPTGIWECRGLVHETHALKYSAHLAARVGFPWSLKRRIVLLKERLCDACEAAHMMSPSNVTQPFNVASVCVEANKTFIAYVDVINPERTASVKALSSVWPSLWPRVDLLIARCEVCFKQKHMSGGTVNTDFWTFLSHAVRQGRVLCNASDMTQLESHIYWPLQSEFYPEEDFFTLWLHCSPSSLSRSLWHHFSPNYNKQNYWQAHIYIKWLTFLFNKARNLPNLKVLVGCDSSLLCASKVDYCCHPATTSMIITH